jgi:hypothetical protein
MGRRDQRDPIRELDSRLNRVGPWRWQAVPSAIKLSVAFVGLEPRRWPVAQAGVHALAQRLGGRLWPVVWPAPGPRRWPVASVGAGWLVPVGRVGSVSVSVRDQSARFAPFRSREHARQRGAMRLSARSVPTPRGNGRMLPSRSLMTIWSPLRWSCHGVPDCSTAFHRFGGLAWASAGDRRS